MIIAIALLAWAVLSVMPESEAVVPNTLRNLTDKILEITVALSFALAFLVVYRHCHRLRLSRWMCSYGRLGLTNYVGMDISGVFVFIMVPCQCDITVILAYTLLVYVLQMIFSVYWMRAHRYGPLEWLWRKATDIGSMMLVKSK